MRVALVHDFLIRLGGAERVLAVLAEMYPEAPIYTLLYDEEKVGKIFPIDRIRVSELQRYPRLLTRSHRLLIKKMPSAIEQWDFSDFDVVISSNTAMAHGVITKAKTLHVSYIHSPMRYAWDWTHEYRSEHARTWLKKIAFDIVMKDIRQWDQIAADRPDLLIANSHTVARRIKKYYRRGSTVIYPPVDVDRFALGNPENFFLCIGALTPYKRIDLAVELFNRIEKKLVIVGDGPQRVFLQSIARKNVTFAGTVPDAELSSLLSRCTALIFPGEEDFGIAPIEAFASGKAVLALRKGGLTETMIEGVTGEFFEEPSVRSLEAGLAQLIKNLADYDPLTIRRHAEQFNRARFEKEFFACVAGAPHTQLSERGHLQYNTVQCCGLRPR